MCYETYDCANVSPSPQPSPIKGEGVKTTILRKSYKYFSSLLTDARSPKTRLHHPLLPLIIAALLINTTIPPCGSAL